METEKQFVPGVFIKLPPDAAPSFILLNMAFKPHEFFTWCQDRMDEKGWVNIQVKKSQKGTIYAELDTWKPKKIVDTDTGEVLPPELQPRTLTDEQKATMTVEQVADLSDIPF